MGSSVKLRVEQGAMAKSASNQHSYGESELVQKVEQKIQSQQPELSLSGFVSLVYDQIAYARRNGVRWRVLRDGFAALGYDMSVEYLQAAYSRETQIRYYAALRRENQQLKGELRSIKSKFSRSGDTVEQDYTIGSQHSTTS